jgi:hypothetical protein
MYKCCLKWSGLKNQIMDLWWQEVPTFYTPIKAMRLAAVLNLLYPPYICTHESNHTKGEQGQCKH